MDACIEKYPEYRILHRKQVDNLITFTQARRVGNNLEEINGNFISYNTTTQTLIFQNHKSFLIKCLLMDCSEKGPEALGQFGEGIKLSMIVLLKTNLDITIESGKNNYYPTVKNWDHNPLFAGKYQHGVLYVKVALKAFLDKTKATIEKVDAGKFQEFLHLSLALLDETKFGRITCGKSTLIFTEDPKLLGKVYKKGVRLELHESQNSVKFNQYSYDFQQIQVGRERDCVNNVWDLYKLQLKLHYNVSCKLLDQNYLANNPHMKPKLRAHLESIYKYLSQNNYQTHFFHSHSRVNKALCDLYYDKFLEKMQKVAVNGEIYPRPDALAIVHNLLLYGLSNPSVDVSGQLWYTLTYSNKYTKINIEIINKGIRELTFNQQTAIRCNISLRVTLCDFSSY